MDKRKMTKSKTTFYKTCRWWGADPGGGAPCVHPS